jgi:hypothetical protein
VHPCIIIITLCANSLNFHFSSVDKNLLIPEMTYVGSSSGYIIMSAIISAYAALAMAVNTY